MRGRFADWLTDSWLDGTPPTAARDACRYAGVMLEDPLAGDPLLAEAGGLVYARHVINWERVDRLLSNSTPFHFRLLPGTKVIGLGFFDRAINGVFGGVAYLDEPIAVSVRGSWSIDANSVYLGLDPY